MIINTILFVFTLLCIRSPGLSHCKFVPLENIFDPFNQPLQMPPPLEGHSQKHKSSNRLESGRLGLQSSGSADCWLYLKHSLIKVLLLPGVREKIWEGVWMVFILTPWEKSLLPARKRIWAHMDEKDSEALVMSPHRAQRADEYKNQPCLLPPSPDFGQYISHAHPSAGGASMLGCQNQRGEASLQPYLALQTLNFKNSNIQNRVLFTLWNNSACLNHLSRSHRAWTGWQKLSHHQTLHQSMEHKIKDRSSLPTELEAPGKRVQHMSKILEIFATKLQRPKYRS